LKNFHVGLLSAVQAMSRLYGWQHRSNGF